MRSFAAAFLMVAVAMPVTAEPAKAPAAARPAAAAAPTPDSGAAVLGKAAMTLLFTRVIGVTGVEKAPSAAIKKLSYDVASASTASLSELNAAAASSGYAAAIPAVLDVAHAEKAELLLSSFDTQFEHEYLDMQIAAHRTVVTTLKDGTSKVAAPAVAAVVARLQGQLAARLASLEEAKRQLPAM